MKSVRFDKLSIVNFLSVGETPVTVEFTKGLHIITGKNNDKPDRRNAIGKSTVADALYFAIFGETLREIKKDLIVNNITGGKTHVELDFEVTTTTGSDNYKIVRTLGPSKVFIYKNGEDKTRDSISNTTKYICSVISASPSIFKNCVIMTVNNATISLNEKKYLRKLMKELRYKTTAFMLAKKEELKKVIWVLVEENNELKERISKLENREKIISDKL